MGYRHFLAVASNQKIEELKGMSKKDMDEKFSGSWEDECFRPYHVFPKSLQISGRKELEKIKTQDRLIQSFLSPSDEDAIFVLSKSDLQEIAKYHIEDSISWFKKTRELLSDQDNLEILKGLVDRKLNYLQFDLEWRLKSLEKVSDSEGMSLTGSDHVDVIAIEIMSVCRHIKEDESVVLFGW